MEDWKMQQGNIGPEADDAADADMAMYVSNFILTVVSYESLTKRSTIAIFLCLRGGKFILNLKCSNYGYGVKADYQAKVL